MKILNMGSINIDYIYDVAHIVIPGETLSSNRLTSFPGGKGANQSVAISKAGLEVYHAGKVGYDGKWIVKKLQDLGVNTKFIKSVKSPSGQAFIQRSKDGENSIILYKGANNLIDNTYINSVLKHFKKNDLLLLQNETSNIDNIIKKAKQKDLKICFNPAPFTKEVLNMELDKIDYLILNEIEGSRLAEKDTLPKDIIMILSEKYPNTEIVLTLGENGVIAIKNGEIFQENSCKIDVVDTTGAGDTFIGFYIFGRLKNYGIKETLKLATKASSIAVTKKGAMDSIPYFSEIIK